MSPFCKVTNSPVLDFWWQLPWVSKPQWIPGLLSLLCDSQIHLWCDTWWLHRSQYCSQAFLIHILTDMFAYIGGGSGFKPTTVCAARSKHGTVNHSATPARLDQFILWKDLLHLLHQFSFQYLIQDSYQIYMDHKLSVKLFMENSVLRVNHKFDSF